MFLFGTIFAITRETLKLRRQVRHCKNDYRAIFPTSHREGMISFETFVKILSTFLEAIFSHFWSPSRIIEAFFDFNSLQGLQLTTSTKKVTCQFWEEILVQKTHYFKFWKKRFFGFYTKTLANSGFCSASLEITRKIQPKKAEIFRNIFANFC